MKKIDELTKNFKAPKDLGLLAVFLGLIIVPSALLAYFSWQAITKEKLLAEQRIATSLKSLSFIAANEFNEELEKIEKRILGTIKKKYEKYAKAADDSLKPLQFFAELIAEEKYIENCFWFDSPGKLGYPTGIGNTGTGRTSEEFTAELGKHEYYVQEVERFQKYAEKAENLEYYDDDLEQALEVLNKALNEIQSQQLKGIIKSEMGRLLIRLADFEKGLTVFTDLRNNYAEVRDQRGMKLSFHARHQRVVCLENLERNKEAIQALLELNEYLFDHSDEVSSNQYKVFLNQINSYVPILLSAPELSDHEIAHYTSEFARLAQNNKKQISQKFFAAFFERKLAKAIADRKRFSPRLKYYSGKSADNPYLIARRFVPDFSGTKIVGLLGIQIDLQRLRKRVFPKILKKIES